MFLLDTNVISELRKAGDGKAHPNVVAWAASVRVATQFLLVVTLMELELGILLLARRDPVQAARLRQWRDGEILPKFRDRILVVDHAVALLCARLHVPNPRPERDAFLAATALVHGMTVVTRNTQDFDGTGVAVVNPWLIQSSIH